jgi:hypothetical protein
MSKPRIQPQFVEDDSDVELEKQPGIPLPRTSTLPRVVTIQEDPNAVRGINQLRRFGSGRGGGDPASRIVGEFRWVARLLFSLLPCSLCSFPSLLSFLPPWSLLSTVCYPSSVISSYLLYPPSSPLSHPS